MSWTIYVAFALCAVEGAFIGWLGLRSRRRGVHVFGPWSGLLRGREVTSRHVLVAGGAVVVASLSGLALQLEGDLRGRNAFRIPIPAGWIDVSPGVAEDERAGPFAALGREAGVVAAAVLVEGRQVATFRAKVLDGGWTPSAGALREQAEHEARALSKPGAPAEISAIDLVTVRQVPAGRYDLVVTAEGMKTFERVYVLPGTVTHAYLVYASADSVFFWKHAPEVEAAAEAVEGMAVPSRYLRPAYLPIGALLLTAVSFFWFGKRPEPRLPDDDEPGEAGENGAPPGERPG